MCQLTVCPCSRALLAQGTLWGVFPAAESSFTDAFILPTATLLRAPTWLPGARPSWVRGGWPSLLEPERRGPLSCSLLRAPEGSF